MGRRLVCALVACWVAWGGVGAAAAQDPQPSTEQPSTEQPATEEPPAESFEDLVREGVEAHAAGDYPRAIVLFQRAYALKADPRLVFNIARAHDRAGHREDAIAQYQRYLDLSATEPDLRKRATEALERLGAPPSPEPIDPVPPSPEPDPEPKPPSLPTNGESPPYALALGGSALGLGVAAVILAGVLDATVLADAIDEFDAAREVGDAGAAEQKQDAEALQRGLIATYVIGGTIAAVGAVVVAITLFGSSDDPAVAAACDAEGCAAVVSSSF